MRMESLCAAAALALACILSRLSADPKWVSPVPVRYKWAGSG
jgi:hypothetical protein